MLSPKKVKYRKQMKGNMRGVADRGSSINFGEYALKAKDWLKKAKAHKTSESSHIYDSEPSCALCGNDLICPSCSDG